MTSAIIFGSFALFLFLTVPIGIAIGLSLLAYILFVGGMPIGYLVTSIFAACDSFPLMAIPFFVLAGSLMEGGGLSKRLIGFADSFVGHKTGGLAVVTVVTCLFFGAISGSGPATVSAIGTIMAPAMIEKGYSKKFSMALVAASGCLGVIIPPSIPMVMYGIATSSSISRLFMGGFFPGILCGLALILLSVYYSRKLGYVGNGQQFSFHRVWREFKNAFWALMVPVIILGGIYGGIFTPTEAAVVAVVYGLVVGLFVYKELSWKRIAEDFANTCLTTATILIIVATGAALAKIMTLEGIPQALTVFMNQVTNNRIVLLMIINLFLLVVGCLMDTTAAILILSPILYPIVAQYGVNEIHFGLIIVINLAIGFITPPVGINLFVACGIVDIKFEELSKSIVPFLLVLFAALLIVTYVPAITMLLPNLLMG
ncbi:MAG: TRAP transporter large permease [Synergistaceae bacterium]|jgi:C4-dicarboxylate transporter DctM subunit|nr:TRAP transporter large permease [Synergistaceae bacterium]